MIGGSLNDMLDAIVVGAGVVGASVAHCLAESGAQVLVLEAGGVAVGTSAATFAVDITRVKTPRELFQLSLASAGEHATLQARSVGSSWVHPAATLEWESEPSDRQRLRDRCERMHAWGYPAQWLSVQQVHAFEPALVLPPTEDHEVAFFAAGGWYEPVVFARVLLDRAQDRGAGLRLRDPVTAMSVADGRITEVHTSSGERLRADVVVNCAGPQSTQIAAMAGAWLPLRRVPGMVVTTTPGAAPLRAILATPDLNIRPHNDDAVMLHSWLVDRELVGATDARRRALATALLDRARTLLPALAGVGVHSATVGERPVPPDGLPLIGYSEGVRNLYSVVSHSAVHLAPILGRLAAHELTGHRQDRLDLFRPTRFRPGSLTAPARDENTRTMLARVDARAFEEPADVS